MDILELLRIKTEDKGKNDNLMLFRIDDDKLLEKCKTIWTKIEDLPNIELHSLSAYNDRYIRGSNVPEDGVVYESFTVICIDSIVVFGNKYYLLVYLDHCAYKIVDKQMIIIFLILMEISSLILMN